MRAACSVTSLETALARCIDAFSARSVGSCSGPYPGVAAVATLSAHTELADVCH
jgi:hypothetical protein